MTAPDLVAELSKYDIRVTAVGERIEIDAPAGALTDELRTKLQANKACVLQHVRLIELLANAACRVSADGCPITSDDLLARLSDADLDDPQILTADTLAAFAHTVQASLMRERGEIPPGWTSVTTCKQCGPVPIFEGCSPKVDGCPWCWNRVRGLPHPPHAEHR